MLSLEHPTAFQIMTKPHGPVCNLDCTYCYYLEKKKLYPGTRDFKMDDELLENYTRQYIESQDVPVVTFTWQGGEPALMGIDFFKKVISLQHKYRDGKKIENAFQTNGTLIDEDWCRFLHDNNFLVGISVDGPREIHDRHRTNIAGKTSFDQVISAIELFRKFKVEFNTLTVVHNDNAPHALKVYDFLKKTGSGYIQFIPIVERINGNAGEDEIKLVGPEYQTATRVTEWSVKPEDYGKFLITIFDEWVRNDVGKVFVQLFDVTLANWVGEPAGLCVFSETCGNAMVLEHNGDLFSCDHFVYTQHRLGNIRTSSIMTMAQSAQQYTFGQNKLLKLPAYCVGCEYRFACHGECPKHRFETTPDGERGLNYLCSAYKMFFSYVHPYMQYMGDELAAKGSPANVMAWARKYKGYSG
ncbi:MAG TPA: anaerobic sulfatase-maturation protein [Bacteroidales bacterium]|nr:anaerobic sulfatase-maturation protein [Bacteroidales bacterium]